MGVAAVVQTIAPDDSVGGGRLRLHQGGGESKTIQRERADCNLKQRFTFCQMSKLSRLNTGMVNYSDPNGGR